MTDTTMLQRFQYSPRGLNNNNRDTKPNENIYTRTNTIHTTKYKNNQYHHRRGVSAENPKHTQQILRCAYTNRTSYKKQYGCIYKNTK